MKTSYLFSDDQTLILELVGLIKAGDLINGRIEAPARLIENGEAIEHTGFKFSPYGSDELLKTIRTPSKDAAVREMESLKQEGRAAIFIHRKLPGFLVFEDAVFGTSMTFDEIQTFVIHFLSLGYRGILNYYRGGLETDEETFQKNASISLFLGGLRNDIVRNFKYRVGVTWETSPAARAFVNPIIDFCIEIGLAEADP